MIEKPTDSEMSSLVGEEAFAVWKTLCFAIETKYDMNVAWNNGGKGGSTSVNTTKGERRSAGFTQMKRLLAL